MNSRKLYLQERFKLIKKLQHIDGVSYAEITTLLTAILSACASYRWPKAGDKKRFLELLIKKTPPEFHMDWVSIPSLINKGIVIEANTRYENAGESARVFTGDEIDMPVSKALKAIQVSEATLRKHCYASLIYSNLRCSYSHEYIPSKDFSPFPVTNRAAKVSYIGRTHANGSKRIISFHLDFLYKITEYHIENLEENETPPPEWWWSSPRE